MVGLEPGPYFAACQAFKKTVLAILRIRINFGSQKVNSAFFLFALCEKILPFYLSDDSTTQVATSWPSLGGGSTIPGSPLDTGRGFYEF